MKPWYFLGGFYLVFAIGLRVGRIVSPTQTDSAMGTHLARVVIGLVPLALLAVSIYSLLFPWVVHPITGLATLGGFVGAALGLTVLVWSSPVEGSVSGIVAAIQCGLWNERLRSGFTLAYGTTLGFGYPRLFWELGQVRGSEGFLFGPLTNPRPGLLSVVAYVTIVFIVSLVVSLSYRTRDPDRPERSAPLPVVALFLAHGSYAACLFLATGLAESLWFQILPLIAP